jgi:hypothetical protein
VLQKLRATLAAARTVVGEIEVRFKNGDPATEALQQLHTLVPVLMEDTRTVGDLPDELRAELAELLQRIRAAVATGDEWLASTEPELIALQLQQRLRRAYGVS